MNARWKPERYTEVSPYLISDDAQRAVRVGVGEAQKPARREGDPDRRGGVVDPAGNTWWLATQAQEEGGT